MGHTLDGHTLSLDRRRARHLELEMHGLAAGKSASYIHCSGPELSTPFDQQTTLRRTMNAPQEGDTSNSSQ